MLLRCFKWSPRVNLPTGFALTTFGKLPMNRFCYAVFSLLLTLSSKYQAGTKSY